MTFNVSFLPAFRYFLPLTEDPFIVVYVQIDEPNQKVRYGSKWAAPVFKNIAEATLKYLNVPYSTDRIDHKSTSTTNVSSNHSLETKNL